MGYVLDIPYHKDAWGLYAVSTHDRDIFPTECIII